MTSWIRPINPFSTNTRQNSPTKQASVVQFGAKKRPLANMASDTVSLNKNAFSEIYLESAINNNSPELVYAMLKELSAAKRMEVLNLQYDSGQTILHEAACGGNPDIVKTLIKNGASLTTKDKAGCTPFFWAVQKNHLPVVEVMLNFLREKNKEEVCDEIVNNIAGNGSTPLYWAFFNNNPAMVDGLMRNGAQKNLEHTITQVHDGYGRTPLHRIVINNNPTLMNVLFAINKDATEKTMNRLDKFGYTPLQLAVQLGHTEMVKPLLLKLLQNGAAQSIDPFNIMTRALATAIGGPGSNLKKLQTLVEAMPEAERNTLVKQPIDVDGEMMTPLQLLESSHEYEEEAGGDLRDYLTMAKVLIQYGANPSDLSEKFRATQKSPAEPA